MDQEERIALFLDYENLALGARDNLGGMTFDLRPIADALAERGRVVVRRAYADWSYFDEDRRMLTRSHVELIDIPQRMGASRKNAADIKMAVDALELAFERDYISTFVFVHRRQRLHPAGPQAPRAEQARHRRRRREVDLGAAAARVRRVPLLRPPGGRRDPTGPRTRRGRPAAPSGRAGVGRAGARSPASGRGPARDVDALAVLVAQTVAGLQRSSSGAVTASTLKRTLLRKDPTFNESDYGFRAFGELLRHLAERNVVELVEGPAKGDPEVSLPGARRPRGGVRAAALGGRSTWPAATAPVALSGLKNQVRRVRPDFSEKKLGYRSFLQFCKAAATSGAVDLEWSPEADDYLLSTTPPG